MKFILAMMLSMMAAPRWTMQTSGVTVRLRGVSAVSERVAWASGADSTVLRTIDGGTTWQNLTVTSDALDFRDVDAVDAQTAYVLSIGNGPASRIYKTTDAGKTWTQQFKNEDPKVFLDAMTFWDANNGIAFGDSVNGQFYILTTADGGHSWSRVPQTALPPALENEGAFAASGTNIAVFGKSHAWIGTGAAAKSRVLHTADRGRTWQITDTRRHRRWRLSKGTGSGRQSRDDQRRRAHVDFGERLVRLSISGGLCAGHEDTDRYWPKRWRLLRRRRTHVDHHRGSGF
jgi:photosystem II stability/assembly factor-like uncharacterized protein